MFNNNQRRRDRRRITQTRNGGVWAWTQKPARTTDRRIKRQSKGK